MSQNEQISTTKRALGYIRISDKKQIEGESPANQKRIIQKYADDNNIKIHSDNWFYDEAKSGKNTEREELQSMLRLATKKKGLIDYIIVYKMSRASRNLTWYVMTIEAALQRTGINIRSATETFDESPMGKFVKHLHVMTAELENDTKREMVIDNMSSLAKQGYWLHHPPRGYDRKVVKNAEGKPRTTITPSHEAPKLKDVLLRWHRGDMTESQLTRYCTTIELYGRNGKPITQDVLHKIIINPVYAGYVCCKLTDYQRFEGKHEGLITAEVYEQNQLVLKMKNKDYLLGLKHHQNNELYPLRRFARCVRCNSFLTAGRPNNSPRYYCHRRATCNQTGSIMTKLLHEQFQELLALITPTKGTTRLLREILKRQVKQELGSINQDVSRIRSAMDSNDNYRAKTRKMYILGELSQEEKEDAMKEIEEERIALRAELSEMEQRQMISEANIDYAINFMEDISTRWMSAPLELKQAFQELVFPNGFVYDIKTGNFLTPDISPLYRLDLGETGANSAKNFVMVIPRRVELLLPG